MRSGGDAVGISIAVSIGGRRRCWTAGLDCGGRSTRYEGISGTRARDNWPDHADYSRSGLDNAFRINVLFQDTPRLVPNPS
jgi:hypothetical protein